MCAKYLKASLRKQQPSLKTTIIHAYKKEIFSTGILQIIFAAAQICQPYFVGDLVEYVNFSTIGGLEASVQKAVCTALLLAVSSLVSSLAISANFYLLRRLGLAVRSGVMMVVYEQTLKLTSGARQKTAIGRTTSLMSIGHIRF